MARSNKWKTETKKDLMSSFYIFFGFIIFALPLIHSKETFDPVLMPQLFAAAIFLLIYTSYEIFIKKENILDVEVLKDPLVWTLSAFTLLTVISAFYALNYKETYFFIAKSIIFLFVTIISFKKIKQSEDYLITVSYLFLIATFIGLLIGFSQYVEEVFPDPLRKLSDGRFVIYKVIGMMAHKNLYASSLFMSLPFLVFGLFHAKQLMKLIFGIVLILTVLMIGLLSTRAVWLGLLASVVYSLFIILLKAKTLEININIRKFVILFSIIILLGVLVSQLISFSNQNEVSLNQRFLSIFDSKNPNNVFRIQVWESTVRMISERPLNGFGAGNWKLESPNYFGKYNFSPSQLNWIRPHNDFLWVFAELGIVGFFVYLGLFVLSFIYIIKIINCSVDKFDKWFAIFISSGLLGYLIISFFDFPFERVTHQVWLAIYFALIISTYSKLRKVKNQKKISPKWSLFMLIPLIVIAFYAYSVINQEILVKEVRKLQAQDSWFGMLKLSNQIPTHFKNIDVETIPIFYYRAFANERLNKIQDAKSDYEIALIHHPTYIGAMNNLGLIYFNAKDFEKAKKYFKRSLEISPVFTESLVNLSAVYTTEGNFIESLNCLERVPEKSRDDRYYKSYNWLKNQVTNNKNN